MPDPKETLLYVLGSEEFDEFFHKYLVGKSKDGYEEDFLDSYLQKIKTPECYVSVLGIQGSGKTSLLNALIFGDEVLPVEVQETTCIPTLVRRVYPGEKPGGEVHYLDGRVEPILLEREFLEKIVDNRYNPGNIIQASYVLCRIPAAFLDEGFIFVDLPGVGSITESNEQTTMHFLRETHIGIFLLRTVPPITESEAGFIRVAWPMVQQSLFVQNLWAQETDSEVQGGMQHNERVLNTIAQEKETKPPKALIPINIAMACRGSFEKNQQILEESGMEELKARIREYAKHSFLKLFYRQTAQFFARLVRRTQQRITDRIAILQGDQREIRDKFEARREQFLKGKEELEEKVARHLEDFLEKISTIKTEWVPEQLESTSEKILEKLDKNPIEDIAEADFRQLVRQMCSDQFHFVYTDMQQALASVAETYVSSLSSTLREMASLEQLFPAETYYDSKSKDPKAAKGWSSVLAGSIAPFVIAGPAGWTIFGGALLAGTLVRWVSGATAHKRIMRGMRKVVGDARIQIRSQLLEEVNAFARRVSEAIRATVKNELVLYEAELQRINEDLRSEILNREEIKAELQKDLERIESFLQTLEYVR